MPAGDIPPNYDFNNMSYGFIPHRCQYNHYPVSRDWVDIDCNAIACINNRNKKCLVPSLAIIGDDGRCINFKIEVKKCES
jgi:hypothetical protein